MKTIVSSIVAISAFTSAASAQSGDFLGWTANVRSVSGGFLVNVYAVTQNATDVLLNVYGGNAGQPDAGFVSTTSAGGFLHGAESQGVWAPAGNQSWTSLDSFFTVGGGLSSGGAWSANQNTVGDPTWNVTDSGSTVSAFNTPSAGSFTNPYTTSVPSAAGWYVAGPGVGDPAQTARSLASLGNRVASSNAAAAAGQYGVMVAQMYVAQLSLPGNGQSAVIDWKLGATIKNGVTGVLSQGTESFVIPAPGALAVLGLAGIAGGRLRR